MAEYKLTHYNNIIRNSDGAIIPSDEGNADYNFYLKWLADGNTPDPADEPPSIVVQSISDRQFFQQLALSGICTQQEALDAVRTGAVPAALEALIDQMPSEQQFGAKMIICGATVFERHHPMTTAIGQAYGWTSEMIDNFFNAAAQL